MSAVPTWDSSQVPLRGGHPAPDRCLLQVTPGRASRSDRDLEPSPSRPPSSPLSHLGNDWSRSGRRRAPEGSARPAGSAVEATRNTVGSAATSCAFGRLSHLGLSCAPGHAVSVAPGSRSRRRSRFQTRGEHHRPARFASPPFPVSHLGLIGSPGFGVGVLRADRAAGGIRPGSPPGTPWGRGRFRVRPSHLGLSRSPGCDTGRHALGAVSSRSGAVPTVVAG